MVFKDKRLDIFIKVNCMINGWILRNKKQCEFHGS